jgi:hypothetical protein
MLFRLNVEARRRSRWRLMLALKCGGISISGSDAGAGS